MESYTKLSEVYDRLIKEDIDYNFFSKSIMNIVEDLNVSREDYLDVGCGTGNLSLIISPYFKYTWLVDSSSPMLSEAFDKFKSKKLNPKIICQDMCSLNLNHKFDLITCTLDAVNYIIEEEDLQSFFCSVSKHLKEEGVFIFDINSYYKLSEVLGNNSFIYDEEDIFYTWENTFEEDVLNMYLTFFFKKEDLYERFHEEHLERAYKDSEIKHMLSYANLNIINRFDGYSKRDISDHTERIVYVVKKYSGGKQ
ncbi:methyltransferase domain-containing protein [Clostridium sp. MSJ-4]|uniref:Methyltransferase domain-containing protein n=1 Tax=Clostridium simiarum TaxID=2841506 RepID=A0ABS6EWM2_9CLOT|nr:MULTISPECIES: class I SAM-dependent methyltransferase [Clostridium]MBU5590623.1 methyltransferase domain-containing protein [Clostridium simiarum]